MIDFNEEYIRTALGQGRSIEDIGNEFAKLLNETNERVQEEQRKAHEEEARKAVEAQKRADIYECLDALLNTLCWYYPMYQDYNEEDIDKLTDTLIASCDMLVKLQNATGLEDCLDALGLGHVGSKTRKPVEKETGGDVSFDTIVKAFLGE